ncbi:MAG: hypothetical protein FJW26_11970 [Acidimicrobiia bacterium]|nr:hypothetical protein [Acidimicrobiia bacterium]
MKLKRFRFKLWMVEVPLWIAGLLWASSAGADDRASRGSSLGQSTESLPSQLTQDSLGGAARARMQAAYGSLPLGFEPNRGQADPSFRYLSRSTAASLFLGSHEVLLLPNKEPISPAGEPRVGRTSDSPGLRLLWLGGNDAPEILPEEPLARKSHYLVGDPTSWRLDVPNYSRLRYRAAYPGIDIVFYGNREMLEYDFVVSPNANLASVALRFEGVGASIEKLSIDNAGDLLLHTKAGIIRQRSPLAFQETRNGRKLLSSRYLILDGGETVGFEVGGHDPSLPVVVDPVLAYSVTGIGGSAIAVDSQGQAYVAGIANPAFVTGTGAFQPGPGGGRCVSGPNAIPCPDILIAKLNSNGTDLIYSTFLGGSGSDYVYGIATDATGNVYVTGATSSTNFPTTAGGLHPTHNRNSCTTVFPNVPCSNAFVTKLNANGSALLYSTYLNGSEGGVGCNGIAVDRLGQAYVTGDGPFGGFVTKLNASGTGVIYSASVGGVAIAIDSTGSAYVAGRRETDSFVSKLSPDGSAVLYSYRLGGTFTAFSAAPEEVEAITGIAVDATGNAFVTGYTAYKDFPTTPGAAFSVPPGLGICGSSLCRDAFVSKLNGAGTALVYSTFLGGDSIDYGTGIVVDSSGNAYVSGVTRSADFPSVQAAPTTSPGGAFIAKLNASGSALSFATTMGNGQTTEGASSIAVDRSGSVFVTGTAGPTFPRTPEAFRPSVGASGGFVVRFFDELVLFVPVILSSAGQNNSFFTSELTMTNRSSRDVTVELNYTAAFGGGSGRVTDTLLPGRQRIIPDAISYLRSLGMPIPDTGNQGGTLGVKFSGLNSPNEGTVTVRTGTAVGRGRVGLAYQGIPRGLSEPSYLFGLRHDGRDRSNVALQNAGASSEGVVTLRLTVFSGVPSFPTVLWTLPDEVLAPGEFRQISGILQTGGLALTNGFVRVERIGGTAPYFAYAVINDQASSDGSLVAPVPESTLLVPGSLTIPVVVESASYSTEVALANASTIAKLVRLTLVADGIRTPDSTTSVTVALRSQEQVILPEVVQWMRQRGAVGLESKGQAYVGAMFLSVPDGNLQGIHAAARTSTHGEGGGQYGVAYAAIPQGDAAVSSVWIHGLQQNAENRSSLGLVNTGEADDSSDTFRLELYDGESGQKVSTVEALQVGPKRLLQIGSIFERYAPDTRQGYLRVTRTDGSNPFIAYSVINDGGRPGQRTGDGAFLPSSP